MKPKIDDRGSAIRSPWLVLAVSLAACTGVAACTSGVTSSADGPGTGTGATGATGDSPIPGGGSSSGAGTGSGSGSATSSGGSTTGAAGAAAVAPFAPVPSGMHRLTATQFANSMTSLLGTPLTLSEIDDDLYIGGFATTGASLVVTSDSGVAQYQAAIDGALAQVFASTARRQTLVGCQPKTPLDAACAGSFVKTFGRLAWRKSLTQVQLDRYTTLAVTSGAALSDPWAGLQWTASALLNSPNFLYRVERGEAVAGAPDRQRYTGVSLASKLAFLIWNSTPDSALLDAGEQGQLATADQLQAQATRLLGTPQGHEAIRNFARELINLGRLNDIAKDSGLYPKYTATLPTAMANEFVSIWEGVAFTSDSNAMDVFTTQNTSVNKELATFYGLNAAGASEAMTPATFPTTSGRSGILTSAALLSLEANQKEGSPTLRGKTIREAFLCQTIPPPPPDVTAALPELDPSQKYSKRERLSTHESVPTCAACHTLMDPLGFALEHFDAIGAYRDVDNTKPIDTTGTLGTNKFDGAQQLGTILAGMPEVTACLVRNMYRYATGHQEAASEEAAIRQLGTDFTTGGNKLKALVLKTVANDGFVYTAPEQQ